MGVPLEDIGAQLEAHELGDLLVHALGLDLLHVLLEFRVRVRVGVRVRVRVRVSVRVTVRVR